MSILQYKSMIHLQLKAMLLYPHEIEQAALWMVSPTIFYKFINILYMIVEVLYTLSFQMICTTLPLHIFQQGFHMYDQKF